MARLPAWMPTLIRQINFGLAESPLVNVGVRAEDALPAGREICFELWPFIEQLPSNIQKVRDRLPVNLEATRKLLDQMADEDRYYQGLYLKQCQLSGLTREQLENTKPGHNVQNLCRVLEELCQESDFTKGVLAIITAELSCTAFARAVLPIFERYFAARSDVYPREEVDQGLEWLNLHASMQTKHALWMKTALSEIKAQEDGVPDSVIQVMDAVYKFWRLQNSPDFTRVKTPELVKHP
ncbi:MAG TPA: hypothetical protein V6C72_08340 [Chroococcales cyanobacterium]